MADPWDNDPVVAPAPQAAAPQAGAAAPWANDAVVPSDPSLLSRLGSNFSSAFHSGQLGSGLDYQASGAPELDRAKMEAGMAADAASKGQAVVMVPRGRFVVPMPTQQVADDAKALQAQGTQEQADFAKTLQARKAVDAGTTPWYDAPTLGGKIAEGATALAGQVAGGLTDPINLMMGGEAVAKQAGEGALSYLTRGTLNAAKNNILPGAVGNTVAQANQIQSGAQKDFSPEELATSTGLAAIVGGTLHVPLQIASDLIARVRSARTAAGATPEAAAAPVTPHEAAATMTPDDAMAMVKANGITSGDDPRIKTLLATLEQRRQDELARAQLKPSVTPEDVAAYQAQIDDPSIHPGAIAPLPLREQPSVITVAPSGIATPLDANGLMSADTQAINTGLQLRSGSPRSTALVPVEPPVRPMSDADVAQAQARMQRTGNANAAEPPPVIGSQNAARPLALPAPGTPTPEGAAAPLSRQAVFDLQRQAGLPTEVEPQANGAAPVGTLFQTPGGTGVTMDRLLPAPEAPTGQPMSRQQVYEAQQRMGLPSEVTPDRPAGAAPPVEVSAAGQAIPQNRFLPSPEEGRAAPMSDAQVAHAQAAMEAGTPNAADPPGRIVVPENGKPQVPGGAAIRDPNAKPLTYSERVARLGGDEPVARGPIPRTEPPAKPVGEPVPTEPRPPAPEPAQADPELEPAEAVKPDADATPGQPQLADTWTAARTDAQGRVAELRADIDRLEAAREARNRGESPPELARYATPRRVDQAIRAKWQALSAAEGRLQVANKALGDLSEGRTPAYSPRYQNAADNRPLSNPAPKPPGGIIDALRRAGGIKDAGGELRARDLHLTPGLVNNRGGMSLHDAAVKMSEDGYLDNVRADYTDNAHTESQLSPQDELLDAIDREKAGSPVMPLEDEAAHQEALAAHGDKQDAINQVADAMGIDRDQMRGMSEGQFADALASMRSLDELAAQHHSQADALEAEFEDLLRARDQHIADNAGPWAPSEADYAEQEHGAGGEGYRDGEGDYGDAGGASGPESPGASGADAGAIGADHRAGDAEGGEAPTGAGQPNDAVPGSSRDFQLQPSDRDAGRKAARPASDQRALEAEGQGVLPGAEGSDRQAIQARGEAPNRGTAPQKGMADFELFDPEARNQTGLFDAGAKAGSLPPKLYSGAAIFDPDTWRFMFGPLAGPSRVAFKSFADSFNGFREALMETSSINRERGSRVPLGDHPESKIPGAAGRFTRAAGEFTRTVLYGDDSAMRAMADRLPAPAKAAAHDFLDLFHARAGEARGAGRTYAEGVNARYNSAMNRLSDILGKSVENKGEVAQIVRLVQNPNLIRKGTRLGDIAQGMKGWLAEHLDYMRKNGVDVGEVQKGYFPRRLDVDAVWRDMPGFQKAAAEAYRSGGMTAINAEIAAKSWVDDIRLNGSDSRSPLQHVSDGFGADHVSGRELPKTADQILSKYMVTDPVRVLTGYAKAAADRAEFSRIMGTTTDKAGNVVYPAWTKLVKGLRDGKAEAIAPRFEDYVRNNIGQNSSGLSRGVTKALGWARAWGTLGMMTHAAMTSATEIFTAPARTGHLMDLFSQAKNMAAYWLKHESADRITDLAEDIGAVTNHLSGSMAAARWTGGDPASAFQSRVLSRYFRGIGLEQWSHGMNVGATGVGDTFMRRLAADMESARPSDVNRAKFSLAELGIPKDKAAAFGSWLRSAAPSGMTTDVLAKAPKDMADAYRTALFRFTRQVHMMPTAATKPRWASHPLGSMAFHLSGYAYAVHTNVTMRAVRMMQDGDLEGANKMGMAAKMMLGLVAAIPAQMALGALRSQLFDSKQSAQAYQEHATETAVSRSGILGAVDPWFQLLSGMRYHKDLGASIAGPAGGRLLSAAEAGVNRLQGIDQTKAGERKTMQALYDAGIAPAANLLATSLPLPVAAAVAQAVGAGATREAFTTATAGPPPAKRLAASRRLVVAH